LKADRTPSELLFNACGGGNSILQMPRRQRNIASQIGQSCCHHLGQCTPASHDEGDFSVKSEKFLNEPRSE
jgi:hypothetical protein